MWRSQLKSASIGCGFWCMTKVQPNILVNFEKLLKKIFLIFTLHQISTRDYNIVQFAHRFYFNDQCHFCIISTKHRIRPQQKSNPKRTENRLVIRICEKRQNPTDSKSVTSLVILETSSSTQSTALLLTTKLVQQRENTEKKRKQKKLTLI